MKRWIILAVLILVIAVGILVFWSRKPKMTGSNSAYPPAQSTQPSDYKKPEAPPPTPVPGLKLSTDQMMKLRPILKKENEAVTKIAQNEKLKPEEKAAAIQRVFEEDRAQLQSILPADQYKRLLLIQNEHAGELVAAANAK
jgi:hypothetical protein